MTKQSSPEYLQIDTNEDVVSVRDRLSFIRGKRVLLIWPEDGTALTRKLDLVLVAREARRRVLQLALVTHDVNVIRHANELGISTFETLQQSERKRWKRGRSKVFIQRYHKPEDEPDPEDLMPVASRILNPRKRLSRTVMMALRVSIIGAVLGIILGAVILFYPSATIFLITQQEQVNIELTIRADPNVFSVNVENAVIPATSLTAPVQTVQQVRTSGIQEVESTRSLGFVSFTNLTNERVTIPAGTIVSTSGGDNVQFETSATINISAGQRLDEVAIRATLDSAGAIGNVAAGAINVVEGDLQNLLEVRNLQPTTGGASQTRAFVTQSDRDILLGNVRGQLQSLAYAAMEQQLTDNQVIVIETLSIPDEGVRSDWMTYSHEVGDFSETLALEMRVVVQALAIDDRFARQVVNSKLSGAIPAGMVLQSDSVFYSRGPYQETTADGQITFTAFGDGLAITPVPDDELTRLIRGMSVQEAQQTIRNNVALAGGSTPQIAISPKWFGRMPFIPTRINIETGDEG